jgi:hypothetical protein
MAKDDSTRSLIEDTLVVLHPLDRVSPAKAPGGADSAFKCIKWVGNKGTASKS